VKHGLARWAGACAVAASLAAMQAAPDVLSRLGITPEAAKEAAASIISGGIFNPGLPASTFKLLPPAARAEAATAGVAWLKAYAATPEFAQRYLKVREAHKPDAPVFDGTPEEELKKQSDEQKQAAEESKKAIASLPPGQRKALEDALKSTTEMIAAMDSPEQKQIRLDAIKAMRAERSQQYQQQLANWQREYPDDPKPMIARRLREFLALSADVDFAAELRSDGGRMLFVNPAYQAKSAQWKMCFRAGKDATTAARAAVQAWLKEL
jgi:hypothetical protein